MIDTQLNPYDLGIGDIITGYNTGIHRITSMQPKGTSIEVIYNQVYSMDGRPVAMNRPAKCDIKHCKPAVLEIPKIKERIEGLMELLNYLNSLATI